MKLEFLAFVALLTTTTAARADDEKVVAIGLSGAVVHAGAMGKPFESTAGVDARVYLTPRLLVGVGYDYLTGEHHYELCGDPRQCYRYMHFFKALGEYHFRREGIVDPFVRVGVGGGSARKGWWTDGGLTRDESMRPFAFVDARVGVSFMVARTVGVGVHASGAMFSIGYGYWSPLGAHLEARF